MCSDERWASVDPVECPGDVDRACVVLSSEGPGVMLPIARQSDRLVNAPVRRRGFAMRHVAGPRRYRQWLLEPPLIRSRGLRGVTLDSST